MVAISLALWLVIFTLRLLRQKGKGEGSKWRIYASKLRVLDESGVVLVMLLTINEVVLYGTASLKIVGEEYSSRIDYSKFIPSLLLLAYYFIYPLRLLVKAANHPPRESSQFSILFAEMDGGKAGKKRFRVYVPLLMIRSIAVCVAMVVFSSSPLLQSALSLAIILLWNIYSLCCCPYSSYYLFFIRTHELALTLQLVLLTVSTANTTASYLSLAVGLLCLDLLQVGISVGLSLTILFRKVLSFNCLRKKRNACAPSSESKNLSKLRREEKGVINETIESFELEGRVEVATVER